MAPHHRTWPVAGLLFASGFCALVYQIGWLREFRLIFGASTAASAAVLAIFIGGLGFGGWLLGRRADAHPRPLALYAQLEAVVALSAAASPLLLTLVRQAYIAVGGTPRLGLAAGTIVRLILSALVLALPTLAMGGTLPAAARAITAHGDQRRRQLATLYGCNTLGAVAGCTMATFFALELFGTRSTLWVAAGLNLIVAVVARHLDRELAPIAEDAAFPSDARTDAAAPVGFVLTASAVVGFAFFLMELVWYRMLGPLLGGSVFTFGLILALALAGIGIGGLLYSIFGANKPAAIGGFALTCLLEATFIAVPFALGDRLAVLEIVLNAFNAVGFWARVGAWATVSAIVVVPAAVVAGYQFPLLVALLGRGRENLGRQLGLTYGVNTIGAIIGSLAGGFGLLPWLSAPGAWRLVSLVLVALGIAAMVVRGQRYSARALVPQFALVGITIALLTATGPTAAWRHNPIGASRVPVATLTSPNRWRAHMQGVRHNIVWEGDGTESSVALTTTTGGYAFLVNGKSDGAAIGDAGTQVMLGALGPILNPSARRALVIGLGSGSTAGWLGAVPTIDRVDAVEIEPLILEVARASAPVNRDVLRNPKVHVTIGDARELLLLTPDRYDIIASEPSNPFRSGVASLFTRDYYQAASDRLTPDGLFLQWVQSYEVDAHTLYTVYATMGSVFPHVETWETTVGDLVLVGAKHPIHYDAAALSARIAQEPLRTALRATWYATSLDGLFAHYVAGDALTRAVATPDVERNEDDRNVVEFGFARAVGHNDRPILWEIREAARRLGVSEPPVTGATLDRSRLRTELVGFYAATGFGADISPAGAPTERARQTAILDFYYRNNWQAARDVWKQQTDGPRSPVELTMAAALAADAGTDDALAFIDQIRSYEPAEADAVLAMLRSKQGRDEETARAIESALAQMATDPWPLSIIKDRTITLAGTFGSRTPELAGRMITALKTPFAAGLLPDRRLMTSLLLSRQAGWAEHCGAAVGALEPHPPWEGTALLLRRDCYAATGDPRLRNAERDLATFNAAESQPFAVGVVAMAH
jgi:spermidine synthase